MSQRIFLSYARGDDERFVRALHAGLTSAGFDVWFDRLSMPSRSLTFYQEIRDAIESCDRLLLVIGPHALVSDYVTTDSRVQCSRLLRLARQGNDVQNVCAIVEGYPAVL